MIMEKTSYKTVAGPGTDEFTVEKSRFIGMARPCATEEEALDFLRETREKYRDARHCCFAYIIGRNMGVMRYSDDGEPGGTAGMPIIETMKQTGVTDCCVAVVRYFGGILLGTGGLTRAYRRACTVALAAAGVSVMIPTVRFLAEVSYADWNRVRHALKDMPVRTENVSFGAAVEAQCAVPAAAYERVAEKLTTLCDGRIDCVTVEEGYMPWPDEETAEMDG